MEQSAFYAKMGERIRRVRTESRDISQAEFADRVGLSRPSIVNIEKGRQHVSSYQLVLFAFALGVSPVELLSDDTPPSEVSSLGSQESSLVPKHLQSWYGEAKGG